MYYCDDHLLEDSVAVEYNDDVTCAVCGEEAYYKAIPSNTPEGKIAQVLLDWIGNNYGRQEAESPCYDILALAQYLKENHTDKLVTLIKEFLCTEEYIKLDGEAIAEFFHKLLNILEGGE